VIRDLVFGIGVLEWFSKIGTQMVTDFADLSDWGFGYTVEFK